MVGFFVGLFVCGFFLTELPVWCAPYPHRVDQCPKPRKSDRRGWARGAAFARCDAADTRPNDARTSWTCHRAHPRRVSAVASRVAGS